MQDSGIQFNSYLVLIIRIQGLTMMERCIFHPDRSKWHNRWIINYIY